MRDLSFIQDKIHDDLIYVQNKIRSVRSRLGDINLNHPYSEETNPNGRTVFTEEEAESWLSCETYDDIANEMGVSKNTATTIFRCFWPAASLALFNEEAQGRNAFKKNIKLLRALRLWEERLVLNRS